MLRALGRRPACKAFVRARANQFPCREAATFRGRERKRGRWCHLAIFYNMQEPRRVCPTGPASSREAAKRSSGDNASHGCSVPENARCLFRRSPPNKNEIHKRKTPAE